MDITNLIGILVSAGCFIFGLYKLWMTLRVVRKKAVSKDWTVTTGAVVSKYVVDGLGSPGSRTYTPEIKYTYTAGNASFEKIMLLDEKMWSSSAEKALEQVGDGIEIRYNPEKPAEHITILEKVTLAQWASILFIFIFSLAFMTLWI